MLAAWLTPAELALFDAQHVADRRHGLDVVAYLRRAAVRDRDVLAAGLLHDCAKGDTGAGPRIAWSLSEAFGPWVLVPARLVPGLGRRADAAARPRGGVRGRSWPRPGCPRGPWRWCASRRRPATSSWAACSRPRTRPADPDDCRGIAGRRVRGGEASRGRHPRHAAAFDGPLALLLALIEARQLDVLTVPLGALADAYLDALATLDDDRMGNVSAFVAVASQLILIKSRAMLPRRTVDGPVALADEGPDPEAELRARLILYRALPRRRGPAARGRARRAGACGTASRPPPGPPASPVRGPPAAEPLDPALLVGALAALVTVVPPPPPPPETIRRTVTLTERAQLIRKALAGADVVVLQDLLRGRPRPGRRRGHVPGHAGADEAARDRRAAGRAVGADRRPPDDARGAVRGGRRRGR